MYNGWETLFCSKQRVGRAFGSLSKYDTAKLPVWLDGNGFFRDAKPCVHEKDPLVMPDFDPELRLTEEKDGYYVEMNFEANWASGRRRKLVTTELLGKAAISNVAFERPDGGPVRVGTDYLGRLRNEEHPMPGPFESPGQGRVRIQVWPKPRA